VTSTAISNPSEDRKLRIGLSDAVVDATFVVILGTLGMVGFHSVYGGISSLLVGLVGLVLGIAVTELARRWNQPVLAEVFVTVIAFLLLGGAVAAPGSALGGIFPTFHTLTTLGHVGIYGWKELLTTAPPVGHSSDLLAIPYIVGLIGGVAGQSVAHRTRSSALPLLGPVLILALGILFGERHPVSLALQGCLFGAVALLWITSRYQRNRNVLSQRQRTGIRSFSLVGLIALASLAAGGLLGPHLPGASSHSRVVLSNYVVPPFEANDQPSPLAGFRQYAKGGPLYSKVLFTVSGLKSGIPVRIATMNEYDGIVWGFGAGATDHVSDSADAFQKYGASIPTDVSGHSAQVQINIRKIGGVWLPTVDEASRVVFGGTDAARLTANFLYNTATGTGAEPVGLRTGDQFTETAVINNDLPNGQELAAAGPGTVAVPISGVPAVLQTDASQWANGSSGAWSKIMAIAKKLLKGYYSDGTDPTAAAGSPILSAPGHGAGRLITFLTGGGLVGTNIVGDDEQYAATFALMANAVGVPARVFLAAVPEPNGTVKGSDVHAWIEVSLAGYGWIPISWHSFVPQRPAKEVSPTQQPQAASSAPVEPPVVSAQRSPLDGQIDGSSTAASSRFAPSRSGFHVPSWAVELLVPIAAIGAVLSGIVGLKRRRRARRRSALSTSSQIAGAWAELLDSARDIGLAVQMDRTRMEQAENLPESTAVVLAKLADEAVFAPGNPSAIQSNDYWELVDQLTTKLRSNLGRLGRWRSIVSLRSFRVTTSSSAASI
jgi:hypothetical protein